MPHTIFLMTQTIVIIGEYTVNEKNKESHFGGVTEWDKYVKAIVLQSHCGFIRDMK